MKVVDILKRMVGNIESAAQSVKRVEERTDALVAGCANQTDLLNRKFEEVVAGLDNQSDLLNRKFNEVIVGLNNQLALLNRRLNRAVEGVAVGGETGKDGGGRVPDTPPSPRGKAPEATLRQAMQQIPLLLAERTYNSSHPDYDARVVRNFPGHIFNWDRPCKNTAFHALCDAAQGEEVAARVWDAVLAAPIVETQTCPPPRHG